MDVAVAIAKAEAVAVAVAVAMAVAMAVTYLQNLCPKGTRTAAMRAILSHTTIKQSYKV